MAKALVNKADRLDWLGNHDGGLAVYDELLARFDGPDHSWAGAEALFSQAIVIGAADEPARLFRLPEPASRELVAKMLAGKGRVLNILGRFDAARAVYNVVLTRFSDAPEPTIREAVAEARAGLVQLGRQRRRLFGARRRPRDGGEGKGGPGHG